MMSVNPSDIGWMEHAIYLAETAAKNNEVPVGAVLVLNNESVGEGWNRPITTCDPTAHAEIVALREAAIKIQNYRLPGSTLYVTLEPCMMCLGAIVQARVQRVVFGASDPKAGAVASDCNLHKGQQLNHRAMIEGGLLAESCGKLLTDFFRVRRS